jgi:hypothetical protein
MWRRVLDVVAAGAFAGFVLSLAELCFHQPLFADDYAALLLAQRYPPMLSGIVYAYRNWSFTWVSFVLQRVFAADRPLFAIANPAALVALATLSLAVAWGRWPRLQRRDLYALAFVTCAYWFGLPVVAETVSWTTGAVAYLWSAVLMLAFAFPYSRWLFAQERTKRSGVVAALQAVLMVLVGFVAGSTHQQVLVVLGFMLLVVAACAIKKRTLRTMPWYLAAGALGFAIGAVLMVTAPGNAVRAADAGVTSLLSLHQMTLVTSYYVGLITDQLRGLYPWLVCILIAAAPALRSATEAAGVEREERFRYRWSLWSACAAASTLPFVLMPVFGAPRTAFFPAVLLVVAALSCFPREGGAAVFDRLPSMAVSVLLALLLLCTFESANVANASAQAIAFELRTREAIVTRARAQGVTTVVVPALGRPAYGTFTKDITIDASNYLNQTMASWYHLASITRDVSLK